MVTIDYDGVSTDLMIILMIEFGIWVIRATAAKSCAEFSFATGSSHKGLHRGFFGSVEGRRKFLVYLSCRFLYSSAMNETIVHAGERREIK